MYYQIFFLFIKLRRFDQVSDWDWHSLMVLLLQPLSINTYQGLIFVFSTDLELYLDISQNNASENVN